MTVYVSRNRMSNPEPRGTSTSTQGQVRRADPPLLTFVWRRLFEQQAREGGRR
ncbi:multiple cyclophane-containing RiPP AmcA [Micromonospora sp. NPDC049230]|uniref:multiple cyclophane-containing RiPP AmcA n=1 Tax=Micromonospora sp. NPDC049230 TaxID=3155502 RepID=UPI00340E2E30